MTPSEIETIRVRMLDFFESNNEKVKYFADGYRQAVYDTQYGTFKNALQIIKWLEQGESK